ncbi:MAG: hypothetical protein QF449_08380 [Alphaproteobacteria bacterium]|nr:hypothetical protein [Alphaproteobacteria bacterium]MDP6818043.1 hypothetical protein [Alphaproteobacteria bacterium]
MSPIAGGTIIMAAAIELSSTNEVKKLPETNFFADQPARRRAARRHPAVI